MDLPPLPAPLIGGHALLAQPTSPRVYFTADQLQSYAREAVAMAMERAAQICDDLTHRFAMDSKYGESKFEGSEECAAAIRAAKGTTPASEQAAQKELVDRQLRGM